jgi:hypothetical protein
MCFTFFFFGFNKLSLWHKITDLLIQLALIEAKSFYFFLKNKEIIVESRLAQKK